MRRVFAVLCFLAAGWFLLPLAAGVSHVGMYFGAGMLCLAGLCLVLWRRIHSLLCRRSAALRTAAAVLVCAALLGIVTLYGMMLAAHTPAEKLPRGSVVLVLGCGVNGTRPSAMLRARCEHALEILQRDETAVCVASGGQGRGEDISEAEAIRRYLTERGIADERIFCETRSTDTLQNVTNSLMLMQTEQLSGPLVIVSDRFHLWRGRYYARSAGVQALASGCRTDPFLAPGYWVRDMGGVLLLLLGVQG